MGWKKSSYCRRDSQDNPVSVSLYSTSVYKLYLLNTKFVTVTTLRIQQQVNLNVERVAPVAEGLRALNHFTAVSGLGSSPALATCETSQVLLAAVPGGFSWGSVFAHLLVVPCHMS